MIIIWLVAVLPIGNTATSYEDTMKQTRNIDDLLHEISILRTTLDQVNRNNKVLKRKLESEQKDHRRTLSKLKKAQQELTKVSK